MVYGKVPPQAQDLEMAILGAILLERHAFDRVEDILRPECFYMQVHQDIYACMKAMAARSMPIDELTLVQELMKDGKLEFVGGPYYVTKLTNSVVSAANIESHARIILQKYISREIIRVGGEMLTNGYEDTKDVFELLNESEGSVYGISQTYLTRDYTSMDNAVVQEILRLEELRHKDTSLTGVTSGYSCLDRCTSGWQKTDFIILAARPSVGKTAFALNLARNAELAGTPVGFFSLEMSTAQLVQRVLSAESATYLSRIRNARFDDEGMRELYAKGLNRLGQAKIYIDDTAGLNIFQLRSKARRMVTKHRVGLIIIDYLQLMTGDTKRNSNREQEISGISREVKKLAKDLNVPIIALSQLSREVEKRGKGQKVPQLSDLRESGAIEQDADLVGFLYRPPADEIAEDANLRDAGMLKLAKHRNGTLEELVFKVNNDIQLWTEIGVAGQLSSESTGSWKQINTDTGKPAGPEQADLPF
jgi:replicative DNA helicase